MSGRPNSPLFLTLVLLFGCTVAKPIFSDGGSDGDAARVDAGRDAGCEPPYLECTGEFGDCETLGWADEANCGGCGVACGGGLRCVAGGCEAPTIVDVALGAGHSCVLLDSGSVVCFGSSDLGQLGDGVPGEFGAHRFEPRAVVMLDDAVAIEAANETTCAIRGPERSVYCWGSNRPERFGPFPAEFGAYSYPVRLDGIVDPVDSLSVGGGHACVITRNGEVLCAGANSDGQLGRTTPENDSPIAAPFRGLPSGDAVAVAAGGIGLNGFTCVAMDDGKVYCVGNNSDGECGQDESIVEVATPTEVVGPTDVVALAAAIHHACALERDGDVWCWGDNGDGQIGAGTVGGVRGPTRVAGPIGVGAIATQRGTVVAVSADGHQLWAWGDASNGQLGLGIALEDRPSAFMLLSDAAATYEAAVGSSHLCYVTRQSDGDTLYCAGSNGEGEQGQEAPSQLFEFTAVPFFQ